MTTHEGAKFDAGKPKIYTGVLAYFPRAICASPGCAALFPDLSFGREQTQLCPAHTQAQEPTA